MPIRQLLTTHLPSRTCPAGAENLTKEVGEKEIIKWEEDNKENKLSG